MALTRPTLVEAKDGAALTAARWNDVLGGIESFYDTLGSGGDYVDVSVKWRGRPVREARVVGVLLDAGGKPAGPAVAAVAPIGDLNTHQLAVSDAGTWRIGVEADGFAPATLDVPVVAIATGVPVASAELELTRTTVPVPDLAGLPYKAALTLLDWAQLRQGLWRALNLDGFPAVPVVIQGPAGGEVARGTPVSALYSGPARPDRTIVPDLRGWPSATAAIKASDFLLAVDFGPIGGGSGTRVTSQSPAPGQIVAADTTVALVSTLYYAAPPLLFGSFAGSHPNLAKRPVKGVNDVLVADADLAFRTTLDTAPWDVARTYLSDGQIDALLAFFAQLGATPGPSPGEDLAAIWASFLVAEHFGQPA